MNAIVKSDPNCSLTIAGAVMPPSLSIEAWVAVGAQLKAASRSMHWWVGDWMNYGVAAYGDKATAIDHADLFGMTGDTFNRVVRTAAAIPEARRKPSLSFSHHAEVAALKPAEQMELLEQADEERLTVSQLRVAIRQRNAEFAEDKHERGRLDEVFNPMRVRLDFIRWANKQGEPETWPEEQRSALKRDLKPMRDLWERL